MAFLPRALLAFVLAFAGWVAAQAQSSLQPVPELQARAMDLSATLSPQELASLQAQLKTLEDETGAQVVILMLASTAPEDIAAYSNRVAQSWKIGRKNVGDGLLIVVAKNDKRMRIEVARALEGAIPDLMAARIIDGAMKPRFQAGDYAAGLAEAVEQLSLLIRHEKLPSAPAESLSARGGDWAMGLLALPLLLAPLARMFLGRLKGSLLMGAGTGIAVFLIERSWQLALGASLAMMVVTVLGLFRLLGLFSGHGGGGGRGGFKSGGGGRFGGGGASGGW
ncbi:TPM domain-containing protein [Comamonas composti]|uniref:TPM domain-containing protein n=1 Tax=Comamonas composti TaxID=408558 RepID=UPI00040FC3DB|nr:TPM domain-containing protein [Comamonas composti]